MKAGDWFYFSKSDRQALTALLVAVVAVVGLLKLAGGVEEATSLTREDSLLVMNEFAAGRQHDSLPRTSRSFPAEYYDQGAPPEPILFAFDPNTADSVQLLSLGLTTWQVRNIYKYRHRGGIYRRKEDFARLYGLTQQQYRRLEPFIRIGSDYQPAERLVEAREPAAESEALPPVSAPKTKLSHGETVDLNTADTALLQQIPGIGSYYSRRIVDYRERLGGYYDPRQLLEIDGFPEEALDYCRLDSPPFRRISVNRMSLSQLRRHPYLSFYQARAITDYRRLHGDLRDVNQLSLLKDFTEHDILRLQPYLEY
ncbi:MAG: helix-hairpin-helix domain-containing protein [Prevotella sp.]|nr:helix-hairpin-helix domain-containing protein [Prevotella sp.]